MFQLTLAQLAGIAFDGPLRTTERHVDYRTFPGHPGRPGPSPRQYLHPASSGFRPLTDPVRYRV